MRIIKSELEIEQGYFRSLVVIAATFMVANVLLLIGFTTSASAQTLDSAASVMNLARMLAAPDTSSNFAASGNQMALFGVMCTGLLVMAGGLFAMTKNLVSDLNDSV